MVRRHAPGLAAKAKERVDNEHHIIIGGLENAEQPTGLWLTSMKSRHVKDHADVPMDFMIPWRFVLGLGFVDEPTPPIGFSKDGDGLGVGHLRCRAALLVRAPKFTEQLTGPRHPRWRDLALQEDGGPRGGALRVRPSLFREHQEHPFPLPDDLYCLHSMIDAYSIKLEVERRLLDPKYREVRSQLREILRGLDEQYGGRLVGVEEM